MKRDYNKVHLVLDWKMYFCPWPAVLSYVRCLILKNTHDSVNTALVFFICYLVGFASITHNMLSYRNSPPEQAEEKCFAQGHDNDR